MMQKLSVLLARNLGFLMTQKLIFLILQNRKKNVNTLMSQEVSI